MIDKKIEKKQRTIFPKELSKEIRPFQKRNNWYNFFSILFDWGIIIGSVILWSFFTNPFVYILSIILIGSRMRGLDNLTHEASHGMLFKNKVLNKWMACFFTTFPVFTSFTTYVKGHKNHHTYLWDYEKDPDAPRLREMGLSKPVENPIKFWISHVLRPVFLVHVPKYIKGTIATNLSPKGEPRSEMIARTIFWLIIISCSVIFNFWQLLLMFWIVPLITTFQVFRYWSEMSDHGGLESEHDLEATRNSFGNPIERFLIHPHHDYYHLVHHLFPGVPHYNLPSVHRILMKDHNYSSAHHCMGYFVRFAEGFESVVDSVQGKRRG